MQAEQKEKSAGLPDSMHQWAQVCVPILPSPPSWEGQSLQCPCPLPFLGNATGLLCCLFLPWAVMPAHPPMVVGSSQATYLGIYSFLSFLGTRQAQAAHSACPGLAWEAVLTFDVCHSPVAAGGQNCLTSFPLSCVHHILIYCSCSNPPVMKVSY